jgi:hypothetical protein
MMYKLAARPEVEPGLERGRSERTMIRCLFRFAGLVSLAAAVGAFAYDGVTSVFAQTVYVSSVGSVWENIPKSWLPTLQRLAQVWYEMIQPYFLKQPVWLVLGIIGAILMWAKEEVTDRTRERLRNSVS